jgi:carbon-monoxide dehydrogenase small subunit
MRVPINITVNGEEYSLEVKPNRVLLDVLREDLGLTGTKKGCGLGKCGACTILLDGRPVHSCLLLAAQADRKQITTIEGIAAEEPHPLQTAFVEKGAVQCGFCTPGMYRLQPDRFSDPILYCFNIRPPGRGKGGFK